MLLKKELCSHSKRGFMIMQGWEKKVSRDTCVMPHDNRPGITSVSHAQRHCDTYFAWNISLCHHSHIRVAGETGNGDWGSSFWFTALWSWRRTLKVWNSEWKQEEQDSTDRIKVSPTGRKDAEIQVNETLGSQWRPCTEITDNRNPRYYFGSCMPMKRQRTSSNKHSL